MKKQLFAAILLMLPIASESASAQGSNGPFSFVVKVNQPLSLFFGYATDPNLCNDKACPSGWAYVQTTGDMGSGSTPCWGTGASIPVMGGGTFTKPGTYTSTAQVISCIPPQNIPTAGPAGILLETVTLTITVLPIPIPAPAPNNPPSPCTANPPVLIDPVAANVVSAGAIVSDSGELAIASTAVKGAAADGVTQLLLQIPANNAGDNFNVQVLNENNQTDTTANVGGLFAIGGSSANPSNSLAVQAVSTSQGPMAFAAYIGPKDFARQGNSQDLGENLRNISFQVSCSSSNSQASAVSYLVRPPVVLIHGLWSSAAEAWTSFIPQASSANTTLWGEMDPQPVDYSDPVAVSDTDPSYSPKLTQVSGNALGFAYNAPNVLLQLNDFIHNYGVAWKVAAVQADVVAHSMGGDIARTLPSLTAFLCGDSSCGQNNYNMGPIHKLITIGTPHAGTQLAFDLLPGSAGDPNTCVRNRLEGHGEVSLLSAVVSGTPVDGAVGDMRATSLPANAFPTAYIGATTALPNLSNLNASLFSVSGFLHTYCGQGAGSPLGLLLTNNPATSWNQEFSGVANDGIVPLTSQLNGTSSTLIFPGVIHSPGIEKLDFMGPSELDPSSGIPDEVINLLNEQISGSDFFPTNGGGSGGGPAS